MLRADGVIGALQGILDVSEDGVYAPKGWMGGTMRSAAGGDGGMVAPTLAAKHARASLRCPASDSGVPSGARWSAGHPFCLYDVCKQYKHYMPDRFSAFGCLGMFFSNKED